MAQVIVNRVGKRYGAFQAIDDVSFRVDDGEFVALVGPSGCGKSTLLRMVAGLEEITDGEIAIGELIVNDVAPKDRDVAMVFQNYALYPHMTVAQNMGFSLKLARVDRAEAQRRIDRTAGILGLENLTGRYPRELSGGQRQRVAMGRAIVRDPAVFLFDEPLSNLDAKLRVQMRAEIKTLHRRLAATMVYVTHDQIEAMTMADRIIVLRDGRIEQVGRPLELYEEPANTFVAGFIGSPAMNIVAGRTGPDGFMTQAGDRLPLDEAANGDGAAFYGVRPEHLVPCDDGLEFRASVVEPMGSEIQIVAERGDVQWTVLLRDRAPPAPGESLRLTPSRVHLFDRDGRTLDRDARTPHRAAGT